MIPADLPAGSSPALQILAEPLARGEMQEYQTLRSILLANGTQDS